MDDSQGGIFISYRREDAQGWATHLNRELSEKLRERRTFYAPQSIRSGEVFADSIRQALKTCSITLVLIGPRWLVATDEKGRRRIDNPQDWVHVEVVESLNKSGLRVVPVLLGGAAMPTEPDLPAALKTLAGLQAHEITDKRWEYDVGRLVAMVGAPRSRRLPVALAAATLTMATLIAYAILAGRPDSRVPQVFEPATAGRDAQSTLVGVPPDEAAPIEVKIAMQKGTADLTGRAGSRVGDGYDGVVKSIVVDTTNLPSGLVLMREYFHMTEAGSNEGGGPVMLATSTGPGAAADRFEHPKGVRGVRFWLEGPGAEKYVVRYAVALTPDGRSSEARNGAPAGDWSSKQSPFQHQLVWLSLSIGNAE